MRKGDIGMEVRDIQQRLTAAGLPVEADGWFGPITEAAVRAFQLRIGLVADGIVGPKTSLALMTRQMPPGRLSQADIVSAADRLGVQVAAIMAVNEVESRGSGFLADGRVAILYERHVMYRLLEDLGIDAEIYYRAHPNIVNRARGGYAGGSQEYPRLGRALSIDQGCAIQATSWGQFQIMGYHWQTCGFDSAGDFVAAMGMSESRQLAAFAAFIEADPVLLKSLRSRKWADFAKAYNGPDYKASLYDTRLARAFERHAEALEE